MSLEMSLKVGDVKANIEDPDPHGEDPDHTDAPKTAPLGAVLSGSALPRPICPKSL